MKKLLLIMVICFSSILVGRSWSQQQGFRYEFQFDVSPIVSPTGQTNGIASIGATPVTVQYLWLSGSGIGQKSYDGKTEGNFVYQIGQDTPTPTSVTIAYKKKMIAPNIFTQPASPPTLIKFYLDPATMRISADPDNAGNYVPPDDLYEIIFSATDNNSSGAVITAYFSLLRSSGSPVTLLEGQMDPTVEGSVEYSLNPEGDGPFPQQLILKMYKEAVKFGDTITANFIQVGETSAGGRHFRAHIDYIIDDESGPEEPDDPENPDDPGNPGNPIPDPTDPNPTDPPGGDLTPPNPGGEYVNYTEAFEKALDNRQLSGEEIHRAVESALEDQKLSATNINIALSNALKGQQLSRNDLFTAFDEALKGNPSGVNMSGVEGGLNNLGRKLDGIASGQQSMGGHIEAIGSALHTDQGAYEQPAGVGDEIITEEVQGYIEDLQGINPSILETGANVMKTKIHQMFKFELPAIGKEPVFRAELPTYLGITLPSLEIDLTNNFFIAKLRQTLAVSLYITVFFRGVKIVSGMFG